MSFDPFEDKHAKAILKKACKGKSLGTFRKNFEAVVAAEMGPPSYNIGGVSSQLGEECLALAEVVAAGRGQAGKVELPVIAEDWLNTGPEFDEGLAKAAQAAVDKVRTNSACWAIAEDMGGWPAWTNYCRGLATRLKKPAKPRKTTPQAEGIDAVIKRLRGKECQFQMEKGHAVELKCTEEGQLSDADLTDIIQLKKLRVLVLRKQGITDKGLGQLAPLKQLRELEIANCQVKGRGFRELDLPRLRELSIERTGANIALANCQKLTGLRKISLRSTDITDKGLEQLAFATALESLDVSQCPKLRGTGFQVLNGLKKLKEIDAIQLKLSRAGFKALCGLTSLRRLELMSAKLPLQDLALLGNLKRLEELDLHGTGVSDTDMDFLKGLRKLTILGLDRNEGITDETVKLIATCLPLLEELSLWETGITANAIDLFLAMKKLGELSVAQTAISRAAEKRLMKAIAAR